MEKVFSTYTIVSNTDIEVTKAALPETYEIYGESLLSPSELVNYPINYSLGWLNSNNLPECVGVSRIKYTNTDIIITPLDFIANSDVLYTKQSNISLAAGPDTSRTQNEWATSSDLATAIRTNDAYDAVNDRQKQFTTSWINKINIGRVACGKVTFLFLIYNEEQNDFRQEYKDITLIEALNPNHKLSFNIANVDYEFALRDFKNAPVRILQESTRIFLTAATPSFLFPYSTRNTSNVYYSGLVPTVSLLCRNAPKVYFNSLSAKRTVTTISAYDGDHSALKPYSPYGMEMAAQNGETFLATRLELAIPRDRIREGAGNQTFTLGNYIINYNDSYKHLNIYYPISYTDAMKWVSLYPRVSTEIEYTDVPEAYRNGVNRYFYYTKVSKANEFLMEFETAASEANKEELLRAWQYNEDYSDIPESQSYSSEDDKPDYKKPKPKDTNDYAEKITPNTPKLSTLSNFTKSYALTSGEARVLQASLINITGDDIKEDVDTGLKLYGANPSEAIIDFRMYPFNTVKKATNLVDLKLGKVTLSAKALGVTVHPKGQPLSKETATTNFVTINFGNAISRHYYDFRDFAPYTTATIFVPYCGTAEIDLAKYYGHKLTLYYNIDYSTGSCNAQIMCDNFIDFRMKGAVGIQIPLTSTDASSYALSIMSSQMAATQLHYSQAQGAINSILNVAGSLASGNFLGAAAGAVQTNLGVEQNAIQQRYIEQTTPVNKIPYQISGTSTPSLGLFDPQTAYIQITRHTYDIPSNYGHTIGYACREAGEVGSLGGFTVCTNTDMRGFAKATEQEKEAIKGLLSGGVYT